MAPRPRSALAMSGRRPTVSSSHQLYACRRSLTSSRSVHGAGRVTGGSQVGSQAGSQAGHRQVTGRSRRLAAAQEAMAARQSVSQFSTRTAQSRSQRRTASAALVAQNRHGPRRCFVRPSVRRSAGRWPVAAGLTRSRPMLGPGRLWDRSGSAAPGAPPQPPPAVSQTETVNHLPSHRPVTVTTAPPPAAPSPAPSPLPSAPLGISPPARAATPPHAHTEREPGQPRRAHCVPSGSRSRGHHAPGRRPVASSRRRPIWVTESGSGRRAAGGGGRQLIVGTVAGAAVRPSACVPDRPQYRGGEGTATTQYSRAELTSDVPPASAAADPGPAQVDTGYCSWIVSGST